MALQLPGIEIAEENENGRFSYAEPNYGGSWTVFRTVENGQGAESIAAELISREQGVIDTAIFRCLERGRRVPMNRIQVENILRGELGLL